MQQPNLPGQNINVMDDGTRSNQSKGSWRNKLKNPFQTTGNILNKSSQHSLEKQSNHSGGNISNRHKSPKGSLGQDMNPTGSRGLGSPPTGYATAVTGIVPHHSPSILHAPNIHAPNIFSAAKNLQSAADHVAVNVSPFSIAANLEAA